MNIVVIDDDKCVLNLLSCVLCRKGHMVRTYDNPLMCPLYTTPGCSCYLESDCPDIIISDVDMPDVDGVSFVEAVFNKQCKCKYVALFSGNALSDKNRTRADTMGVRFFTKPLDFAALEDWMSPASLALSNVGPEYRNEVSR